MTDVPPARSGGSPVTLERFPNEPLARLAAERLRGEGIPCMVRPMGVGPGLWGVAASIPYALDTWPEDADAARATLGLLPPDDVDDFDYDDDLDAPRRAATTTSTSSPGTMPRLLLWVLALAALALVVQTADAVFGWLLG